MFLDARGSGLSYFQIIQYLKLNILLKDYDGLIDTSISVQHVPSYFVLVSIFFYTYASYLYSDG